MNEGLGFKIDPMEAVAVKLTHNSSGGWIVQQAERVFHWLERLARRRVLTCALMVALPMVLRVMFLPVLHIPAPEMHDEFSYLLAADTYASGRLTNPPHPMWVHFETFHEIFQPTYASKYFPGQGLFLALGWKLLGHPWYGVWISYGFMFGCLCWMLQGWMPNVYALVATLVTMGQISIFGYWMNSYWGGAVAAAGGCLVLGALPRLARRSPTATDTAILALGLMVLANTRPYEGLILSAAAMFALLWWRHRRGRSLGELCSVRNLIPFLLIGAVGAAWIGYYNFKVTGSPWLMPYTVYNRTYLTAPQFVVLPEQPVPSYHHKIIEGFFTILELGQYQRVRSNPLLNVYLVADDWRYYCSILTIFAAVVGIAISKSLKAWIALALWMSLSLALLMELRIWPHYVAPGLGLIPIVAASGLRTLRVRSGRIGYTIVVLFTLVGFGYGFTTATYRTHDLFKGLVKTGQYQVGPRDIVASFLAKSGGRHLVLVRYGPSHSADKEYVYNAADIDKSAIVWARDMGEAANRELLNYYPDRKVWLWQPDIDAQAITPYGARTPGN